MGVLDPPAIKPAFRAADGTVTPLYRIANENVIPEGVEEGDFALIESVSDEFIYGAPDVSVYLAPIGDVTKSDAKTGPVHGVDDMQTLAEAKVLGFDPRLAAWSMPLWTPGEVTLTHGTLYLSAVSVYKDMVVTKFGLACGTVAQTDATLVELGLFESFGNTLVLRKTSGDVKATQLVDESTEGEPTFTVANFQMYRGVEYRVGLLVTGSGTPPAVEGIQTSVVSSQYAGRALAAQTSMPSSIDIEDLVESPTILKLGVKQ